MPGYIAGLLGSAEIYTLYLPFLLVFALFYALLAKTQVFGKGSKANKINALIAIVISLYVVVFSPFATSISTFFATFFAEASVGLVTLLVFVLVVGLLLGPFITSREGWERLGKKAIPLLIIVAFLFVLGLFFSSAQTATWFSEIVGPSFGLSGEDVALIVLIVITLIVLYWLVSGEEGIREVKLLGE